MLALKRKLAYAYLELLISYEMGTPHKYEDLLNYMEACEAGNLDQKYIQYLKRIKIF